MKTQIFYPIRKSDSTKVKARQVQKSIDLHVAVLYWAIYATCITQEDFDGSYTAILANEYLNLP